MVGHRTWEEVHHPWEGLGSAPGNPTSSHVGVVTNEQRWLLHGSWLTVSPCDLSPAVFLLCPAHHDMMWSQALSRLTS